MAGKPLNIAYIVDSFPALSETFILDQITGMIARGHRVTIFAHEPAPTGTPVHADVERFRLMERVRYVNVPEGMIARVFSGMLVGAAGMIRHPTVVIGSLNPRRFGRNALNLRMLFWTVPFLDERFDIIHAHYGANGSIASDLRRLGVPGGLVCQFHGYDIRLGQADNGERYRGLFQRCNRLLAISDYSRVALLGFGAPPDRIVLHPNGIDAARFAVERPALDRLPDPVRILSVGRLVEVKGIVYALRALGKIMRENPEISIEYRIAGDGPLRNELEALSRDLGIGTRVSFLGPLIREKVIDEMKEAHLFLMPSLSEGFGLAAVEALACGCPVIATHCGGLEDIVADGTGYLVPPGDHISLAEQLAVLLAHPEHWHEMGQRGRDHVVARFDIDRLDDRLERLYYGLVAES